ncbi:MAG: thiamine diphosphokinase [Clostridia bacterium]|nr:thiamine diphosphokinase [Clostridia bacterium]
MKRCVILGGAPIENVAAARSYLRPDDFIIACDSGLRHLPALGLTPDLIVGDFDSCNNPHLPVETIVLPCEKDDTDTVFAVREALSRGFDEFLLLGAAGGRLDHSLGNVALLLWLDSLGKRALLADDYSDMTVVSSAHPAQIGDAFPYFSLLAVDGAASGVCVQHAKYPLENADITPEYPYGVSNEPLPGQTATVSVGSGRLLLIRIFCTE